MNERDYSRTVCLPMDEDIAGEVVLDSNVTITLKGKVVRKEEVSEDKTWGETTFEVQLSDVEVSNAGEYDELLEDDE
jgi:hypothetical protein